MKIKQSKIIKTTVVVQKIIIIKYYSNITLQKLKHSIGYDNIYINLKMKLI